MAPDVVPTDVSLVGIGNSVRIPLRRADGMMLQPILEGEKVIGLIRGDYNQGRPNPSCGHQRKTILAAEGG